MPHYMSRRSFSAFLAGGAASLLRSGIPATVSPGLAGEKIKAFCIDFNWSPEGRFAPPGMYAQASPEEHFRWYRELGVNTIQTFCVSCCGYAWYRSGVPPVMPGMRGDFLALITSLGHGAGIRVMGYFCIGANSYWGDTHPALSHGVPGNIWHIPFTNAYLDYLSRSIEDVLKNVPIDGFMVDWLWSAKPSWLECEKFMYREFYGERFPGADYMTESHTADFMRRAVERAWIKIREAAKSVNDRTILWLSCSNLRDPQVAGSRIFKETDWLMNEHPDPASLELVRQETGLDTKIIQCLCGWGPQNDAEKVINDPRYSDAGFYGFAMPDPLTTLPPTDSNEPRYKGNARNIEIMRKVFTAH